MPPLRLPLLMPLLPYATLLICHDSAAADACRYDAAARRRALCRHAALILRHADAVVAYVYCYCRHAATFSRA